MRRVILPVLFLFFSFTAGKASAQIDPVPRSYLELGFEGPLRGNGPVRVTVISSGIVPISSMRTFTFARLCPPTYSWKLSATIGRARGRQSESA